MVMMIKNADETETILNGEVLSIFSTSAKATYPKGQNISKNMQMNTLKFIKLVILLSFSFLTLLLSQSGIKANVANSVPNINRISNFRDQNSTMFAIL